MIDLETEEVFPIGEVPEYAPRVRAGKKIHKGTGRRWVYTGVAGIKMEAILVGGTLCTSRQAIQRFFERLTAQRLSTPADAGAMTMADRKNCKRIEDRLSEIGI